MAYILFSLSVFVGFLFGSLLAGKHEGDKSERSLRLHIKTYTVHLHHWFISSILLIVCVIYNFTHPIVLGLLVGSILQGLTYKDRFLFIYKTSDFENIYAKWRK